MLNINWSRGLQWFIHFIIAMVFIKYIHYKYGFEQTVLFAIMMINAELVMIRSDITRDS